MGLRHLVVLDDDHRVAGIITRKDITEHRLEHHWFSEGDNMQKFINVDPVDPGMLPENMGLLEEQDGDGEGGSLVDLGGMNPLNMTGSSTTTTTTTVATAAPIVTVAQFEVSDRSSSIDDVGGSGGGLGSGSAGYVAPSIPPLLGTVTTTPSPPPPPTTTTTTTSSTSRTREQRAMKEPKSLRK